jgi:hypothetical protein
MELTTPDLRRLVCSFYRSWLVLGVLATLVLPAARGADPLLGAWPLWLVGLPAASLALMSRR